MRHGFEVKRLTVLLTSALATAGAGVLVFAAPALAATVLVNVSPGTAEPGGTVTVLTTCESGEVRSPVFPSTSLQSIDARTKFRTSATVTIDEDAQPSVYGVEARCDNGESGIGELVVLRADGPPTGDGSAAGGASWPLLAGGVGLLAVAGVGGWLGRSRRAG